MAVSILKRGTRRIRQSHEEGRCSASLKPEEPDAFGNPSDDGTSTSPKSQEASPTASSKKIARTGRRLFFGLVTTHEFDKKKPACIRLDKEVPLAQAAVCRWESDASSAQFKPNATPQSPTNRSDATLVRKSGYAAGGATPKLPNRRTSMEMLDSVTKPVSSRSKAVGGTAPKLPSRRTSMEMMLKEETIVTVRTLAYSKNEDSSIGYSEEQRTVNNTSPRQPSRVESEEAEAATDAIPSPSRGGKQARRGSLLAMFQSRHNDSLEGTKEQRAGANAFPRQPLRLESEEATTITTDPSFPSHCGKQTRRGSLLAVFQSRQNDDNLEGNRWLENEAAASSLSPAKAKRRGSILAVLTRRNSKEESSTREEASEVPTTPSSPNKPKRRGGIKPRAEYGRRARRHESMRSEDDMITDPGSALELSDDEGCHSPCRRWSMASNLPSRRLSLAPTNPCYAFKEGHASPVVQVAASSTTSTASTTSSSCSNSDESPDSPSVKASSTRSGRRWSLVACLPGSTTNWSKAPAPGGVPRSQSMPHLVSRPLSIEPTSAEKALSGAHSASRSTPFVPA